MKKIKKKLYVHQNAYFMSNTFFLDNHAIYEILARNMAQPDMSKKWLI